MDDNWGKLHVSGYNFYNDSIHVFGLVCSVSQYMTKCSTVS